MDKVKYTRRQCYSGSKKRQPASKMQYKANVFAVILFFFSSKCAINSQVNQLLMQSVQTHILITSLTQQRIQANKRKTQWLSDLFPQVSLKRPPHSATQCSDGSGTRFNSSESLILNTPPSSSSSSSQPCHLIWMPLRFFLSFSAT